MFVDTEYGLMIALLAYQLIQWTRPFVKTVTYIECLNRQHSLVINIVGTDDISLLPRRMVG